MSEEIITTIPTVALKSHCGLVNNKSKDGWKLLEDTPIEGNPELELVGFLEEGESSVKGDAVFERAKKIKNRAGQQHLERLLTQENRIPKEWRVFWLVFPGTKWCDSDGRLRASCLYWSGDGAGWCLYWRWLYDQWNCHGRLVQCR